MLRFPSIRLARILGIPVEINVTWFAVFALVAWSLSSDYYPMEFPGRAVWVDTVSGVLTALAFFASLIAHEFSHSLVARRSGIEVQRITLFLFGGVAQLAEEPRSPGVELGMALAGPVSNLAMGTAWFAAYRAAAALGLPDVYWAPLLTLAMVNAVMGVFNLAPGFPMDGGRVLRAFLWWASGNRLLSTRIASLGGRVLGVGVAIAGCSMALIGSLSGLWLVLLGAFLYSLASRAYASQAASLRVAAEPVSAAMDTPIPTVGAARPLSEVARMLLGEPRLSVVAVMEGEQFIGLVDADAVAAALNGDPAATAASAAVAPHPGVLLDAAESLETAVRRFDVGVPDPLIVVKDGRLAGQLSRKRLGEALVAATARQR